MGRWGRELVGTHGDGLYEDGMMAIEYDERAVVNGVVDGVCLHTFACISISMALVGF